jgi:ankyrin repeat protein
MGCESPLFKHLETVFMMLYRFRWVYCQLDNLRRCMPSNIRKALNELPATLDDTYERILLGIPKQKRQHGRRLFQSMVAAIRPLRVEELAEVFAIEFDSDAALNLVEDWRPENPEEAVLSACSTLISVVIDEIGTKIVQFSHFSVKEFLTSDRLQTSVVGNISQYYIALETAHTFLARTCLAVLLQLDKNVDQEQLATLPLALYAAQHWIDHAKFENVTSRIQDAMECLFNPMKPHFQAWLWIYDMDARSWESVHGYESLHGLTPLYYVALCGFSDLARHLIITHAENVSAECRDNRTPLHAASHKGHVDVARVFLDHGADVDAPDIDDWTPLHLASDNGHLKVVQLLLEHEATLDAGTNMDFTPLYLASDSGHLEVVRLLLEHRADVNCQHIADGTPLQAAIDSGYYDIARLLLDHGASHIVSYVCQPLGPDLGGSLLSYIPSTALKNQSVQHSASRCHLLVTRLQLGRHHCTMRRHVVLVGLQNTSSRRKCESQRVVLAGLRYM